MESRLRLVNAGLQLVASSSVSADALWIQLFTTHAPSRFLGKNQSYTQLWMIMSVSWTILSEIEISRQLERDSTLCLARWASERRHLVLSGACWRF